MNRSDFLKRASSSGTGMGVINVKVISIRSVYTRPIKAQLNDLN
jgi:hypothetical protein